ncbi:MAG: MFS transporter [Candidatus Woesearchaeota archaeon]
MQKKSEMPKDVYLLGLVSFLVDISSEMIFSVFSIFFTIILGASTALLGIIEGLADFASSSLDYVSGVLADRTGKKKSLAIAGYGFSALAKTLLLITSSIASASLFRVIERLGKSFRGPPRDAWIASLSTDQNRGYAFGIHKTFDKSGAIIGPLIAYWLLSTYGQSASTFQTLFAVALVPAVLAIILLLFIKENPAEPQEKENIFASYNALSPSFKHYLKTAGIFSLAYFSYAFLLLKAYDVGFEVKDIALLYASFNVSFVLISIPVGKLGDYIGRRKIIAAEYILYALMCIGMILATTELHIILLFLLFGIFFAVDEGQSKAFIGDLEKKRRGTAIGLYNFIIGIIYLPASIIAGALWNYNPDYAFMFAAGISAISFLYFISKKN